MSLFFVDSSCDLGKSQIKKLGIECIDLSYSINDKIFCQDDEFEYAKFYSKLRKGTVLNEIGLEKEDYINIFSPILETGEDIVYVYNSARTVGENELLSAKDFLLEKYPNSKMLLINSKNVSCGHGVVCYLLAMKYRSGASLDEIEEYSLKIIDEIATYCVVDSLEYLSNYNKIDGAKVSGTALNIKPIVAIDIDGNYQLVEKVSGKKKALGKLIEIIRQRGENVVDYPIAVCHSGAEKDAQLIVEKLKEYFGSDIQI
ncbi:MAG: DegV family EDD domain-containing protein, partial [Clostridia bacterium]|nr:DegV family EDD domain-containing protein [Clostridia bacterium]